MRNIKRILFFLLLPAFIISLCSCAAFNSERFSEETSLTDPYGGVIPVYEDVELSVFDPEMFISDENGRMFYNDENINYYTGIDVSSFQGDVDYDAVKNDGIDFVILRAGFRGYGPEGSVNSDASFFDNYEKAKNAGLKIGVYFFSQAVDTSEAVEEAEFLLDLISGLDITYPVAYDWEVIDYDEARTDSVDNETVTQCAAAFCDRIAQAGYVPIIYFNRSLGYFSYDLSVLKDYDFWLAEYGEAPSFIYNYKIWQYTKDGSVAGISGSVDINISLTDFSKSESVG